VLVPASAEGAIEAPEAWMSSDAEPTAADLAALQDAVRSAARPHGERQAAGALPQSFDEAAGKARIRISIADEQLPALDAMVEQLNRGEHVDRYKFREDRGNITNLLTLLRTCRRELLEAYAADWTPRQEQLLVDEVDKRMTELRKLAARFDQES
jgi:hypothetical protein